MAMRHLILLLFSVLIFSACDRYVDRSESQALVKLAHYSSWIQARADKDGYKMRQIGVTEAGLLREDEEFTIPLDITGAHRAVVLAACDKQCFDMDLRVVTEDGRLIGVDDGTDDWPQVYIDEKKTNKLFLKVRMSKCAASNCAYAVDQLQYDDFVGGFGTCFAVAPDGWLMTSFHVVDGAEKITVRFPDGRDGDAKVIRTSEDNDLALLRVNLSTPSWLPLSSVTDIEIGTPAFTLGFPSPQLLGSEIKLTEGSVSSLAGAKESTLLQISIPIHGGNSGGPVLDYNGRVLGIVESVIETDSDGSPMQLASFARHARVASLLLPSTSSTSKFPPISGKQEAISKAKKAVCQIETK
jgi:hypothetical protein